MVSSRQTRTKPAATSPTDTFTPRYAALNDAQRQAVDTIDGAVMVVAGPGTGKTQLVAMRVANILRQTQMDPYNILCLTFTESGVAAMRRRLLSIIGPAAYHVRINTFHSFCHEVIQEWPEKFSFARELEAIAELERVMLLEEIINELPGTNPLKPFGSPYLFLADIAHALQQLKQEHITVPHYRKIIGTTKDFLTALTPVLTPFWQLKPAERTDAQCAALAHHIQLRAPAFPALTFQFSYIAEQARKLTERVAQAETKRHASAARTAFKNELKRWWTNLTQQLPKQQALVSVYRRYEQKLRERGRYDFEDMILFVLDRFSTDDQLLAYYQEQFQYILADEYQDTNGAQNELLFQLAEFQDTPNLFVVGDDKQAIYRFQGATLDNLLQFYERYHSELTVITLTDNYRSQQTVLDAAAAVAQRNRVAASSELPSLSAALRSATAQPTHPLSIDVYPTPGAERHGIAEQIKAQLAAGTPPGEIAVLSRRNREAHAILETLRQAGIPATVRAGENALDNFTVQQLLTLVSYLVQPTDGERLWRLLYQPWLACSPLELTQLQIYAQLHDHTLLAVLADPDKLTAAGIPASSPLTTIAAKLATWRELIFTAPVPLALTELLTATGLLTYYAETNPSAAILRHLQAITAEARHLTQRRPSATMADFLQHISTLQEHKLTLTVPITGSEHEVQVMTAHRAKGLEFTHVFMTQATDQRWGSNRQHAKLKLPRGLIAHDSGSDDQTEDERRLWYVAMTRAKTDLTISYATTNDAGRDTTPSRFIAELPVELTSQRTITPTAADARREQQVALTSPRTNNTAELTSHLERLLERYTLSVTHLNNYLRCPRLFYYQNLLRVPYTTTQHMAVGSAIHAALHDFFVTWGRETTPQPSVQFLLDRFAHHLTRQVATARDHHDGLDVGQQFLKNYYEQYHATLNRHALTEYNFGHHGVNVHGVRLTGLIDKIEIIDPAARLVNVVDYKTGQPDSKRAALKPGGEYHRQLVFYKLLCDHSPRFGYHMRTGEIDFIQPNRAGQYVKKQYTITATETDEVTELVTRVWSDIMQLKFLTGDGQAFCGECQYCQLALPT